MTQDYHKEKEIISKLINSFYSGATISNFQAFELFEQDFNSFDGWKESNNIAIFMDITRSEPFSRDEQRDICEMVSGYLPYETSVGFNGVY